MKDKIILADDTTVSIEYGSDENTVQILTSSIDEFQSLLLKFTEDNLKTYRIETASGRICSFHHDKYVKNTVLEHTDEGYLVSFNLVDADVTKKELMAVKKELATIKSGQNVQDCAISDLGDIVSELALKEV